MSELPTPSEYLETSQGLVRTNISGTGKITIVISPDPPNIIEHYRDVISELSKSFRVVTFEPIGFGFSHPSSSFDFSIPSYTDLVGEILGKLDTKDIILALPCIFGFVAINYVKTYDDERVRGIIMIQTPSWEEGKNWIERIDQKNLLRRRVLGQLGVWKNTQSIQKRWYKTAEPDENLRNKYLKISNEMNLPGYNFCLASPVQSIYRSENPINDAKIHIPAIILWGNRDKSHPETDPNSIAEYFDNPILREIEDAGHFPEMSATEILHDAIKDLTNFINKSQIGH